MRTAIVAEQIQKKKEKRRNMALFIELLLMGVGLAMVSSSLVSLVTVAGTLTLPLALPEAVVLVPLS